jgi:hypothetical protein
MVVGIENIHIYIQAAQKRTHINDIGIDIGRTEKIKNSLRFVA